MKLLTDAGIPVRVQPSQVDESQIDVGDASPREFVVMLAQLKARDVGRHLQSETVGTVLAADTVCVVKGEIFGQPCDRHDARRMLHAIRENDHETITGVCLKSLSSPDEHELFDAAIVRVGEISDEAIEAYLDSGDWQGKAGAYNLSERIDAGWPIECQGDPTTVMGLPMLRLLSILKQIVGD